MSRKRKIIIIVISCIITVLLSAGLGISYFMIGSQVGEGLLRFNEGNDTKDNSLKQLGQWGYDLQSFEDKFAAASFSIPSSDGIMIPVAGYLPDTSIPEGTVILVHGLGGDHVSMAPLAELYLENGFVVYALDQRGSANSESPLISFGYYEKEDVAALVSYAKEKYPSLPVTVHGQSMGSATAALYAATDHALSNLDALVLDSTFDSMKNMFLGMMELEGLIGEYFVFCGGWYLGMNYGFDFSDTDVIAKAPLIKTPALVIQCSRDEIAPAAVGKAIYEAIGSTQKAYWQSDSLHIEAFIDNPQAYEAAVMDFLSEIPAGE